VQMKKYNASFDVKNLLMKSIMMDGNVDCTMDSRAGLKANSTPSYPERLSLDGCHVLEA
jgi:hypothetical protein